MYGRKRILLVSNGFYPEISPRSYRATELAKELGRQGHIVKVITKFRSFDYTPFLIKHPIELKMWKKSRFPQFSEFGVKRFAWLNGSLSRILSLFLEYPGIEDMFKVRRILKPENSFDLMISFAVPYPVHWGVAWARTSEHQIASLWIADCGDPYMGDVVDTFRKPFYFKFFEKGFCKKADFISVPIEGAINGYYMEFRHKIRVIPQGFDFEIINGEADQSKNEIPEFAYSGSFIPGVRDPDQLLKFLGSIKRPFRFNIYTNQPELYEKYKELLKGRLSLNSYVPREQLLQVLRKMDFLINFDNNSSLNSPSKLIDYAIVGRPVLNITNNFNPDDVYSFLDGDYKQKMNLPDPEQFHIRVIAEKFLEISDNN